MNELREYARLEDMKAGYKQKIKTMRENKISDVREIEKEIIGH